MPETEPQRWHWAVQLFADVAMGRHWLSKWIPVALFLVDVLGSGYILWKVPYTEIDWTAYMEQVSQFVKGERDYTKMEGGTGPLVYPAAHVYIYTALYYLTDEGKNIFLAQQLFAGLYLATLALVMLCYWDAGVPPTIFPTLIFSKRLHSIFMLRCFNDCFAVFFLWLAIFCFQRRFWTFGAAAYSWGLGIKMSLLLVLPAVVILLFLGRGFWGSLRLIWIMVQVQLAIAVPFISKNLGGYLGRAFEFSRVFKFEWTVNWRFLGEEMFLSKNFALVLLALHVAVLLSFIHSKWVGPADRSLISLLSDVLRLKAPFSPHMEVLVSSRITPVFVMDTILSAMVIGLLFARSLHYQFYAYLAWATPYLVYRFSKSAAMTWVVFHAQEWAWNVFPSTTASSLVAVGIMANTVLAAWCGPDEAKEELSEARAQAGSEDSDKNK